MLRQCTQQLLSTGLGWQSGLLGACQCASGWPDVSLVFKRWATKKQGGSTKNKKDSHPKHLGCKMLDGQLIYPGQIIVRQRGTRFHPGYNVGMGRDHTLFAKTVGILKYKTTEHARMLTKEVVKRRYIHIVPIGDDWTPEYSAKATNMMEQRRLIKQQMTKGRRANG